MERGKVIAAVFLTIVILFALGTTVLNQRNLGSKASNGQPQPVLGKEQVGGVKYLPCPPGVEVWEEVGDNCICSQMRERCQRALGESFPPGWKPGEPALLIKGSCQPCTDY